jgi:hypothetical protein
LLQSVSVVLVNENSDHEEKEKQNDEALKPFVFSSDAKCK